jgi:hypothetical protein
MDRVWASPGKLLETAGIWLMGFRAWFGRLLVQNLTLARDNESPAVGSV